MPDLISPLARDAAAPGAFMTAQRAAETLADEIFLDVAEDEMEHYAETMAYFLAIRSRPKCSQKLSTCW